MADSRIKEAALLLNHGHWTGAYYLTGLSIECALKACLAKAVRQGDFPDKSFINQAYTHKLETLAMLDGELWVVMKNEIDLDVKLASNWSIVKQWQDDKRYEEVEHVEAESLYTASMEPVSGVMEWIRRRW